MERKAHLTGAKTYVEALPVLTGKKKDLGRKGGIESVRLYGGILERLTPEQRQQARIKGGREFVRRYGNPANKFSHEDRVNNGRKGGQARNKEFLVHPLLARGASDREVMGITDLSYKPFRRAKKALMVKAHLQAFDTEARKNIVAAKSSEDKLTAAFLRRLIELRFIPETTNYWKKLGQFCQKFEMSLADSFTDAVCFETFYVYKMLAEHGKSTQLQNYVIMGEQIDPRWFYNKIESYHDRIKAVNLRLRICKVSNVDIW